MRIFDMVYIGQMPWISKGADIHLITSLSPNIFYTMIFHLLSKFQQKCACAVKLAGSLYENSLKYLLVRAYGFWHEANKKAILFLHNLFYLFSYAWMYSIHMKFPLFRSYQLHFKITFSVVLKNVIIWYIQHTESVTENNKICLLQAVS